MPDVSRLFYLHVVSEIYELKPHKREKKQLRPNNAVTSQWNVDITTI